MNNMTMDNTRMDNSTMETTIRREKGLQNIETYCNSKLFEKRINVAFKRLKEEIQELQKLLGATDQLWLNSEILKIAVKHSLIKQVLKTMSEDVADEDVLDMLAIFNADNLVHTFALEYMYRHGCKEDLRRLLAIIQEENN